MSKAVKPVPEGYRTLTPNLVCRDAAKAIDFYKVVFDAVEVVRMPGPDGKIMHAELKIGDSILFVNEPMSKTLPGFPQPGGTNPAFLHIYTADVDAVFRRAVDAGARVEMEVQDMFWGDRYGKLTDPYGQQWSIATHTEDVSSEEMARRQHAFFAKAAAQS
jgi:PhnB protein